MHGEESLTGRWDGHLCKRIWAQSYLNSKTSCDSSQTSHCRQLDWHIFVNQQNKTNKTPNPWPFYIYLTSILWILFPSLLSSWGTLSRPVSTNSVPSLSLLPLSNSLSFSQLLLVIIMKIPVWQESMLKRAQWKGVVSWLSSNNMRKIIKNHLEHWQHKSCMNYSHPGTSQTWRQSSYRKLCFTN